MKEIRYTIINYKNIGSLIILLICCVGISLAIKDNMNYKKKLVAYNGVTLGVVTNISHKSPNLAMETFGTIEFSVDKVKYTTNEKLSIGINYRPFLKNGDNVIVHYEPNNPHNATGINNDDYAPVYLILGMLGLIMLIHFIRSLINPTNISKYTR